MMPAIEKISAVINAYSSNRREWVHRAICRCRTNPARAYPGVFHRGTTAAPAGVDEIRGDRNQLDASALELKRFAPDVVIDLVISSGSQAEELMNIFRGATQRVVMLSSIDVYRAIAVSQGTRKRPPAGRSAYGRVGAAAQSASLPTRGRAADAQDFPLGDGRLRQDSRRSVS